MTADDLDLLREFTRDQSQAAFTTLVQRHLDLVYCAALRQVRSPQLAEEVAQSVFTDLAQNAARLKPETILTAWLYAVTRRTAINVVRGEARRQLREQIAFEMNTPNAEAADWNQIEPLLDEAMHSLDETDQTVVLLRYFENKSLREVGQRLGTSDDAAQKRVSRAVERLRAFFTRRGIAVGASSLVFVISGHAVQGAPSVLAQSVTAVALAKSVAANGSTLTLIKGALKLMAWSKAKTAIVVGVAVILAAGTTTILVLQHRQQLKAGSHFPRSTWAFAGYTNPESAFLSGVWALGNGDAQAWLASLSPDQQTRTLENADRQQGDIIGARDRADFAQITGYRIMGKQTLSADEVTLEIFAEGLNQTQRFSVQRFGSEWKVAGPVQKASNRAALP